jgi:hypothetical protein
MNGFNGCARFMEMARLKSLSTATSRLLSLSNAESGKGALCHPTCIYLQTTLSPLLWMTPLGIQGISLPGLSTLTNLSFVDDSTLYLQGAETNLDRAKDTLQDFCLASGSFVN